MDHGNTLIIKIFTIPFGNLPETDKYSFISDVFFCQGIETTWIPLPHCHDKDLTSESSEAGLIESDENVDLEVERSGVSENVSIELEIIGLP